jgi:hypothetical protein
MCWERTSSILICTQYCPKITGYYLHKRLVVAAYFLYVDVALRWLDGWLRRGVAVGDGHDASDVLEYIVAIDFHLNNTKHDIFNSKRNNSNSNSNNNNFNSLGKVSTKGNKK